MIGRKTIQKFLLLAANKAQYLFKLDILYYFGFGDGTQLCRGTDSRSADAKTVDADGLEPGGGPTITDTITWSDGKTIEVVFKATTASDNLVGDVQIMGPLYGNSSGLKLTDGTNVATYATSWAVGDVVKALATITSNTMSITRG